jgi:AraC family transcriptional regulator
LTNSLRFNVRSNDPSDVPTPPTSQSDVFMDRRSLGGTGPDADEPVGLHKRSSEDVASAGVDIAPAEVIKRQTIMSGAISAEIVQVMQRERIEFNYRGPLHLLIGYEQGTLCEGIAIVEGLPSSNLRDLRNKFTFVPAGHLYRELQELRALSRMIYVYLDPARMPILTETGATNLPPRLHFENAALWETAYKLMSVVENASADDRLYLEALVTVLAHELARLEPGTSHAHMLVRGGLAMWQQRIVTSYIEEHLPEQISLATLAGLVRLSPYHFCRAFKQSFGMPPHRYHTSRRIERAKTLLAKPEPSVTDIGLKVGFSQTSSFTAAFRRATGFTPTAYYRSLG